MHRSAVWCLSLVGFYNVTKGPYNFLSVYEPYSYNILQRPEASPCHRIEHKGRQPDRNALCQRNEDEYWTPMDVKVTDRTFAKSTKQNNGADVKRAGAEPCRGIPGNHPDPYDCPP